MIEFVSRLVLAAAVLGFGSREGSPVPAGAIAIWMVMAACATLQIQREKLLNPGLAGFLAVADSWSIGLTLALFGQLDFMGFFALAPCLYAVANHQTQAVAIAPLAAGGLIIAHAFFRGGEPTGALYGQALGVLGLGVLAASRVATPVVSVVPAEQTTLANDDLELRENYRALKGQFQNLERRALRDRLAAEFLSLRLGLDADREALAQKLKALLEVDGVTLYRPSRYEAKFVAASSTEDGVLKALELDPASSRANLRSQLERSLRSEGETKNASVAITHDGRVLGLLALTDDRSDALEKARKYAEDGAGFLAELILEVDRKRAFEGRARTAEALYEVASLAQGAATPNAAAARLFDRVFETLHVDHLGVSWLDGDDALMGISHGENFRLLDALRFAEGAGVNGWRRSGAPEVVLFATTDDVRCDRGEALRRRIGSFAIFPIQFADRPYGFVTVGTRTAGGIDVAQIETLRVLVAELGQTVARLEGHAAGSLMTKGEFAAALMNAQGAIVVIEPVRRNQLVEAYGEPTVDRIHREFALRTRAKLPKGGALIQRESGALVAFLRDADRAQAESWANEIAASASLLSLHGTRGREFFPFAVRAKVAAYNTQSFEFSPLLAS